MIATQCRHCREKVFAFARACRNCGAPNKARMVAIAVAVGLAVLVVVGGTIVALLRGHEATHATPAASRDEFGWLSTAMAECDAEAAKAESTLEFLVVPLTAAPAEAEQWRKKSLNDIGNAILLTADDMLDGLKRGALSISAEQYLFSIRDEATGVVYKWSPSAGVKKFLTADASAIEQFKVQLQLGDKANEAAWGMAFVRRKGNCYWVNAILSR
jgi:hypothetical protein